jgi:hypothetical protein
MNEPTKLEGYITTGWKCLLVTSTLAYCTHLKVLRKVKCCEYNTVSLLIKKKVFF